jgi:hypothetical protein
MLMKNDVFLEEIKFFGLDKYLKFDKRYLNLLVNVNNDKPLENFALDNKNEPSNKYQKYIWKILEQPNNR